MSLNKKSVKETVQEKYKEFTAEVDKLSIEELKGRIVGMQQALAESEANREGNETLAQLKAETAEISGPYNDVKKAVKLKTKYIIDLINEKGE